MSDIGVGLVGYKFMGRAHSNAYRQVPHFFEVDPKPRMVAICGRDEASVKEAAENLGWEGYETDYKALIARPDIQLIDVSTPGDTHKDVVLAALRAGKHVICEKPLANNLAEAREIAAQILQPADVTLGTEAEPTLERFVELRRAGGEHLEETDARAVVRELKAVGGSLKFLRLALTGAERGPELWTVVAAVPREEALRRAAAAITPR